MQDYNYVWGGVMEITLEMSCCKYPRAHRLPQFWADNKHALLKYLGETHQGKQQSDEPQLPKKKWKIMSKNK